ncbi:hypothetical protein H7F15_06965 [Pontibacter sp. Tf4]|uniref:hypothetical protein n=1 Tax=Pontibacter sp. Tf4 TaxID=2761620 RepID=UPI001627B6ED|nr:hypothetical protein [Pontibacter sp. Tf4]MBB6610773.1 hypothetical protein [Pontibacter sp. Tf4]
MKKTLTTVFTLLVGSTLLFSCKDCAQPQVTDPTQSDLDWLVYERTSMVDFVNEKEETVVYKFANTAVNNVPGIGYSVSDECIDKLDSQGWVILQDTTDRNLNLITYFLKRPDKLDVKVSVENRGEWSLDIDNPTYPTIELDGQTYTNVYEVTPDSTKPSSVKQILFNKAYGFLYIGFYDGKYLLKTK